MENAAVKKMALKRALDYLHMIKQAWNDYLEEVDAWFTTGEGKRKGFTFPYCFHGMSRWTDYDNICHGCEEGFTGNNPLTLYRWALDRGKADVAEVSRRSDWMLSAPSTLPDALRWDVIAYVLEPIERKVKI